MRLRSQWLLKALIHTAAFGLRGWVRTLRCSVHHHGPNLEPDRAELKGRYIYAIWHEYLLVPMFRYGRPDLHVLISQHADGELVAGVCRGLGFSVVRGSSTRGGAAAVRQLVRASDNAHLVLIPDGPRGPRRQVKQGLVYLAARTGLPIVPVGFGFARCWRFGSWDRFALPFPWTRAVCVTGEMVTVPADIDREQLEGYRAQVEQAMLAATACAEEWAAHGMPPSPELGRAGSTSVRRAG